MTPQIPSPSPLLPKGRLQEFLLSFIMAIMAFLAALTLLSILTGFRLMESWSQDLSRSATVEIFDDNPSTRDILQSTVSDLLRSELPRARISFLTETEAQELIKPWLGDGPLPEGLPFPLMFKIEGMNFSPEDKARLSASLEQAGLDHHIDDHTQWQKKMTRSWRGTRLTLLSLLGLVFATSICVVAFATRSVLRGRKLVIDSLTQVGATDFFIMRQFIKRYFILGLKAGALGAFLAGLIMKIFDLLVGFSSQLIVKPFQFSDSAYLCILIVFFAIICAATAAMSARRFLQDERRSQ